MNVKIIEPSSYGMDGKLIRNPRMWITGLTAIHLAALTPDSHNVSVCNEIIDRIDFDEDVDVVALSAMGPQIFRAEDYREYNVTNVVFQPAMMSQEALSDGLWVALRRFYSYPKIVNRLARTPSGNPVSWGSAAALNILYRRMVYGNNHKHPNIWHAPYVEKD